MLKKMKITSKRKVVIIIGLLSVISLGYIYFSKSVEKIPAFSYIEISTKANFTANDLKNNYKKVFIYFSPSCDDCSGLFEFIRTRKDKFVDSQILMVSTRSLTSLQQYAVENDVKRLKNITILYDSTHKFVRDFHLGSLISLPTILVFNSNNTLVFNGGDKDFRDLVEQKNIVQN